jgi:hypothetical protein
MVTNAADRIRGRYTQLMKYTLETRVQMRQELNTFNGQLDGLPKNALTAAILDVSQLNHVTDVLGRLCFDITHAASDASKARSIQNLFHFLRSLELFDKAFWKAVSAYKKQHGLTNNKDLFALDRKTIGDLYIKAWHELHSEESIDLQFFHQAFPETTSQILTRYSHDVKDASQQQTPHPISGASH